MANKPIKIGAHARFEMRRRGIKRADVIRMNRRPSQIPPSIKGREIYQGLIGRMRRLLLRVIVKEEVTAYHVITTYKTSKIAKYWRP